MLGLWLLSQLTVFNLAAANLLTYPVEAAMRAYYVHSAETIMRQVHPVVIGITGSYGKTSTKEILAHLLGSKYEVLKTPKTYNTIMGVCMVIREQLKPNHKYFIVEMGAYKPGEIARICRLVHPQMAILTAIGPQHLERFRTIENIAHAKNELIQALPADGTAIINGDDPICRKLADEAHVKVLTYGMQPDSPSLNLRASQPITSESGASFDITLDGQPAGPVRTQLLGRHNITNALGAMLTAMQCGLSATEAVHALASVTTLEHRLQIIRNPGGIVTIDNAYSSNPSGSQVALEVLGSFKNGRKVIVTPGFAELGKLQAQEHAKLGHNAAQVCDLIFLIGSPERVSEIMAGVREAGFDLEKVFTYPRLAEAREKLREVLQPGDVVLFENDLPDTYSL
jgi:UDP-N-acetylmuramoyl-tripeptide--D-alanyl-D-alanine ligase